MFTTCISPVRSGIPFEAAELTSQIKLLHHPSLVSFYFNLEPFVIAGAIDGTFIRIQSIGAPNDAAIS